MTEAVKERGEVAIKEAGDGVVLRLNNRDHKTLQEAYGKQWMMAYINDMSTGSIDIIMTEEIARLAAKDVDGKPVVLPDDAFDKLTVINFGKRVLDAITMSVHGQTFEEFMEEQAKKIEEAALDGKAPPNRSPDMTTLTTSDEKPSGQELASTSSGESHPAKRKNTSTKA